ncbi:MAG: hypothetical protein OQL06_15790 [Gammaproteobacteria bacterium]|nr:hypothetical protein [Gammaproteobacteria bacterium]
MSGDMYEVAFRGEIAAGADAEQVRASIGKMFKADAAKLAHLFSGKRVVIKKNIDQATATKYKVALENAGAICEVKNLSETIPVPAESSVLAASAVPATATTSNTPVREGIPPAPDTDPLHITGDQISELSATLAPPGSDVQDEIKEVAPPELDISSISMAAPGSDLAEHEEKESPPPPNTDGLSIVED